MHAEDYGSWARGGGLKRVHARSIHQLFCITSQISHLTSESGGGTACGNGIVFMTVIHQGGGLSCRDTCHAGLHAMRAYMRFYMPCVIMS
jgi:hypothetical protein